MSGSLGLVYFLTVRAVALAIHQTHRLTGSPDIELKTPRTTLLHYRLALPEGAVPGEATDKPLPGLVVMIPGFGADNDASYVQSFGGWVADTFGFGCVTVGYHAYGCRPSNGAQKRFTQQDADRLVGYCQEHGVVVEPGDGSGSLIEKLHKACQAKADAGRASGMITLTCGLSALNGERQNFGLMQALDHLHVLADLRAKLSYDKRNVLAIGSSHGGYLAQLIAKLAPNTLRAVFDNAGYAAPPPRYINGREANLPDYIERYSELLQVYFFLDSMWSLDSSSGRFFHADARAVRRLNEPDHLEIMVETASRRTRYRCVHGPADPIAPTGEKEAYCQSLAGMGFDVSYRCMGPGDVDGRYVKSLDHGCGLSLRGFFERSYASLPESGLSRDAARYGGDDFDRQTVLLYPGPERTYRFAFVSGGVQAELMFNRGL